MIVQRYGEQILGGAESHAREFVDAIRGHHEVTVLTSCAIDGSTWDMHFAPGPDRVEGVEVLRFAHGPRNAGGRARVPRRHKLRYLGRRLLDGLRLVRVPGPTGDDADDGHEFLRRQGPTCPDLLRHLRAGAARYDAAVFFTALYHPTAEGLPLWGARSVLVPLLHDEKAMYLPWFHRVFAAAGETLYNTDVERRLARRLYGNDAAAGEVVGIGVMPSTVSPAAVAAVRRQFSLPERYLVYLGRIEKGKGCLDLVAAWRALGLRVGDAALVFVGHGSARIAAGGGVHRLGFLPVAERDAVLAGARALVMPSRYESLSAVLLQAMALGVPVLANAGCEVLLEQVRRSRAGTVYRGAHALRRGLLAALDRDAAEREALGDAGRRFVDQNYRPEGVARRWLDAIERCCHPAGELAPSMPQLRAVHP